MITVHHLETSRSQRILWLLEELAIPYEIKRYARDANSRLAPPELKAIHPLGKAPVITDGQLVIAESGAIIEYLCETYGDKTDSAELRFLQPQKGTDAYRHNRFWMHYAEGLLMNWLVMKLVFSGIPAQPMPFFVKPIARGMCNAVMERLIDPNLDTAMPFINDHLAKNKWFSGEHLSMADFQMSFAIEALLARAKKGNSCEHVEAFKTRINARPAYQVAIQKGGPVLMNT